jgi:acetyl-CoA C-acetyltransferase
MYNLNHAKRFFSKSIGRSVVIVGAKRTPIGSFMGTLSNFTGPQLGKFAVRGALAHANVDPKDIEEVFLG